MYFSTLHKWYLSTNLFFFWFYFQRIISSRNAYGCHSRFLINGFLLFICRIVECISILSQIEITYFTVRRIYRYQARIFWIHGRNYLATFVLTFHLYPFSSSFQITKSVILIRIRKCKNAISDRYYHVPRCKTLSMFNDQCAISDIIYQIQKKL